MYMILCRTKVDNCGYTRYNEKLSAFGTSKFCLLKISDIFLGTLCWFQSFEESTSSLQKNWVFFCPLLELLELQDIIVILRSKVHFDYFLIIRCLESSSEVEDLQGWVAYGGPWDPLLCRRRFALFHKDVYLCC